MKKSQVFLLKAVLPPEFYDTNLDKKLNKRKSFFLFSKEEAEIWDLHKLLQILLELLCYASGAPCISCPLFKASYPAHTEQNVMWPPVSCQLIGLLTRPFCSAVK